MTVFSGFKHIGVGLPGDNDGYADTGRMIVDTLGRMGYRAEVFRDGDPRTLSADGLILYGCCTEFSRYPRLLRGHSGTRPVTALWHIEPLPPPELSARAEQAGLRLARWDWENLPRRYANLTRIIPWRSRMRDVLRRPLTAQVKAGMPETYRSVHPHQLCRAMFHYYWFRTQYHPAWCHFVFVSTPARRRFLADRGIPCGYVPMCYHRDWGEDLGTRRDIDVLFIGRIRNTSRCGVIETLRRDLADRRINLVVVERDYYGQERTELLNRTRIVVDVLKVPWEMPVMRSLICISCGALVISTWPHDPTPFSRDHLVQAPIEAIPDRVRHYLAHEDERRRIVEAGRRFLTTELTMENMVGRILTAMNTAADRPSTSRSLSGLGLNGLLE